MTIPDRFANRPVPRRVSNDVGAAVAAPVTVLEEWIEVVVQVSWDDAPPEPVVGMAIAYTREYVHVEIRDRTTSLKYRSWVPAADVRRVAE